MLKKVHILYTIPNFDTAGSGKVLYDLAKGLNPDYFEVSIACKHDKGSFFKTIEALGLPIHIINPTIPLRPYWSFFFRIRPLIRFFKMHQFDIVHSWNWSSDWSEVLATRMAGAKFVYTKKAMSWGNLHWKLRSYLSHFIVTVNDDMKAYFPNKKQQQLIPFGLDLTYFKPELFKKIPNSSKFTIVTVAHLVPVKHIDVILHAIKQLSISNIHLEIIGDDTTSYATTLKQLTIDLQLEHHVSFLGKHGDIRPFLAQADLYVISSQKEGMPMALVEAMAMGVPVLGSDVPGIRFVLKDFKALLFDVHDVAILSQKINSFYQLSAEDRIKAGKQLRDYCVSNFSIHRFIKAHESLYLELMHLKHS